MIKPIQTLYNGILFRSRLEARWAMYFDRLGVEWIYEHEGFDLGDGLYYLPDFYFPHFDCYAEVKPLICDDERWHKLTVKGGKKLIILIGSVNCSQMRIMMNGSFKYYKIPHVDSEIVCGSKLYCGLKDISSENQQFCDEANSFRF